ncbi:MAG: choice-of-anchor Q domain-containing protein, partial [Anaerolineales bacterium]
SDLTNTGLIIDALAMNGGNSLSHALLPGSPAIDSGDMDTCLAVDQRNVSRPQGSQCDRGAYEATGDEESGPEPGEGDATPAAEETATATPEPLGPIDINFNADSYTVAPGECTTVRWEVQNAERVYYEGTQMPSLEAEQVCPTDTTTYQLVAENAEETEEAFVTIEVVIEPPNDPGNLELSNYSCTPNGFNISLSWEDRADNEDGYRVYRDGSLLVTLGPDTTSYGEQPPLGGPYEYGVEAFNEGGASSRATITVKECQ